MKGPNLFALHDLFHTVAADAAGFADSVAERIAALGDQAEGSINAVGRRTTLPAYPVEIVAGWDQVDALSTSMAVVGKRSVAQSTEPSNLMTPTPPTPPTC